jgi:hypothetical protein
MRTRLFAVASAIALAGCSPTTPYERPPEPPPPALGYTLSGLVSDQFGVPLAASDVQAIEAGGRIHRTQTGADGRYRLTNLTGPIAVVVSYELFPSESKSVTMTANSTLDFVVTITPAPPLSAGAIPIAVGEAVNETIDAAVDPFCEPNWDSHSPCRQFVLVPQASEDVRIVLTWVGAADALELHLINPLLGRVLGNVSPLASTEITARVEPLHAYEIRVMAYYGPMKFRLSVERK